MVNPSNVRPQRPTAINVHELRRLDIDIAALGKTRMAEEGQLKEHGGYTFFWKGKPHDDRRIHGLGFAIKNLLLNRLHEPPVGISERLMAINMKLKGNQSVTVISAYAPTLNSDDENKEIVYSSLDRVMSVVPACSKKL